jgi:hypothetical protein
MVKLGEGGAGWWRIFESLAHVSWSTGVRPELRYVIHPLDDSFLLPDNQQINDLLCSGRFLSV